MKNVGTLDKMIRFGVAAILIIAGFMTEGTTRIVLWAISAVPLVTAAINFCPLWAVLKINTGSKN
jgi:hypothetical protein